MTDLIRPGQVAKDLAVSRTWVYDAANAGRIPSIRIGGEEGPLRFVPEDLDRWIDEARKAWRPGGGSVATRSPCDEGLAGSGRGRGRGGLAGRLGAVEQRGGDGGERLGAQHGGKGWC